MMKVNGHNLLFWSRNDNGDNKSVVEPKQPGEKPKETIHAWKETNAYVYTTGAEYELEDIGKDNPTFDEDSGPDEEGRGVGVV